jgi:transcriptional regulator with PAS, ATPase and Fis domain
MVAKYAQRFQKKIYGIDVQALRTFEEFPWPGNIRQLENMIQQAVLNCTGAQLQLSHLPSALQQRGPDGRPGLPAISVASSLAQNRETAERAVILRALESVNFSRTRAAEILGVSRVTLYKKMKKYGLLSRPGSQGLYPVSKPSESLAGYRAGPRSTG